MDRMREFAFLEKRFAHIQRELSQQIKLDNILNISQIEKVAGVDLAYWKEKSIEYAVCCTVVLERKSMRVIENKSSFGKVEVPYIPGYLAFRELPLILETVKKLNTLPDLYMFDGNGYLHPRHMGIATHASFYLNRPTIGIAKSYYKIDDTEFIMPPDEKNAYTDIVIDGIIYGRVLRTVKNVRPVFVSAGNYIDLDTATQLVRGLITKESHIPLPTRLADIETHRMRKELQASSEHGERTSLPAGE